MPEKKIEKYYIDSPIEFSIGEGKLFVKELVWEGTYIHPDDPEVKIDLTLGKLQKLVDNFHKKLIDIPFVPLKHTDDPEKNTGEIVDLFIADSPTRPGKKSLFAKLKILVDEVAEKIGKTIKGISIGVLRVVSPETGEYLGDAVEHTALTNRPYLVGLADFEEVAMSKKIQLYVFDRSKDKITDEDKNKIKEDNMDIVELEKKVAELQRENVEKEKVLAAKFEAEKKEREILSAENKALKQANFESGISHSLDMLVQAGKMTPAEKNEKFEFAKTLNEDQSKKYIADLEKLPVKIKVASIAHQDQDAIPGDAPKCTEIHELAKKALTFAITREQFDIEMDAIVKRAEKAGWKMDKTGVAIFKL